jgi:hypothetical protein
MIKRLPAVRNRVSCHRCFCTGTNAKWSFPTPEGVSGEWLARLDYPVQFNQRRNDLLMPNW